VLADPSWILTARSQEILGLVGDADRALERLVTVQVAQVAALGAKLVALSPQGTLDRGYALVTLPDGALVTQPAQAPAGSKLKLRLAGGVLTAQSTLKEIQR
jgi:exodeoxyribonuclease VII large subunit